MPSDPETLEATLLYLGALIQSEASPQTVEVLKEAMRELVQLRELVAAYRAKRAIDGINGRHWNATRHWDAEQRVRVLEREPLMSEGDGT